MKVRIETHLFDTNKASHHWDLYDAVGDLYRHWDLYNIVGDLYRSSKGYWYVHLAEQVEHLTSPQWTYRHTWMLIEPAHVLSEYDRYLKDDEKAEIAELTGLDKRDALRSAIGTAASIA